MGIVEYEQLRIAEEVGRLGSFAWDLETNQVQWSVGLCRLLYLPEDAEASYERWMSMVDPEYREFAEQRGREMPTLVKQPTLEYPMVPFEGSQRVWLRIRSRRVLLVGRPTNVGVAYDITPQILHRQEIDGLNRALVAVNKELADTVQLLNAERFFPRS